MPFHSLVFLIFGAVFFLVWPLVRGSTRGRLLWILTASLVFYGWWDPRYLILIVASGGVDFLAARRIHACNEAGGGRFWLYASLAANLGILGTFKYLGFLVASVGGLAEALGLPSPGPAPDLTLPVGISFYTFQSMSYTIDVYRGKLAPTRSFLHFLAYLSMFPQLVAGPIVRARALLPQLLETLDGRERRFEGTRLVVHGYFKKMVIADGVAPVVDAAFASGALADGGVAGWVAALLFGVQIYCDFSGYSDIARGLGLWMDYDLGENFDHPYTATSLRDFWRRWHISLSSWFRDYVYIPLGGRGEGSAATYRNLWITFLLSGLWHGAAWTFVLWGAFHALALSLERATAWPDRVRALPAGALLVRALVLAQVTAGWILFRAPSVPDAAGALEAMLLRPLQGAFPAEAPDRVWILVGLLALREAWVAAGLEDSRFARATAWTWFEPVQLAVLVTACVFLRGEGHAFLYFQF